MPVKKIDGKTGEKKTLKTPQLLRGFKDILPSEEPYWNAVEDAARSIATNYSFGRLRLPVLEQTSLFERSIGKATDVVEKEMYTFIDPSNTRVTLRPEATAGAARAYIEHGMVNKTQPVKMWYFEPMFRHDRPQAGRYRQFYQFGLESIGSSDPILDAQMILMTHRFFKGLGVEVKFLLNSIGTEDSRREYVMELVSYFKQFRKRLSDVDKKRLTKNPLRLLDSKEEGMDELRDGAPQILDWLDDDSKQHFMKVLEYLDEAEVPYELNPYLVRGLDYYTKTVFEVVEITDDAERAQNSLGGGGRYDTLIELLGGREETPAIGIALGVERVIMAMKNQGVEFPKDRAVDVFFCQLGDASRKKGLMVFEDFRVAGVSIGEAFGKGALKAQLEMADKRKAKIALILGQKEVLDGTIIIRDMESGAQEIVNIDKVVPIVKRQLEIKG